MKDDFHTGDPVEVKKVLLLPSGPDEKWWPATVVYADDWSVGVAYANGIREVIERDKGLIRKVEHD